MKKCVMIMLVTCFPLVVGCGSSRERSTPVSNGQSVEVGLLLAEVQKAIDIVERQAGGKGPKLTKAVITVSTERVVTHTGKAAFILSVSASRAKTRGQKMVLELKPRGRAIESLDGSAGNALANQILAAVEAVSQQSELDIKKLSVSANLKVVKTVGVGIKIEISGISLDGSGSSLSRTSLHSIELVYGE